MFNYKKNKGVSLVEIIVAIAVLGIIFATIGGAIIFGVRNSKFSGERDRANSLAVEGIEAVRNIRDNDFANLNDGTYGISNIGNEWVLTGSQDVTDDFTRSIDITSLDSDTKEIVSNVSWDQGDERPGSTSIETILTNWQKEQQLYQTIDIAASDDNLLYSFGPTRNYGGLFVFGVANFGNSVLRFDTSAIPSNSNIMSARMALTSYSNNSDLAPVTAHEILSGNSGWLEGNKSGQFGGVNESSWNYLDTGNAVGWAGSSGLNTAGTDYETTAQDSVTGPWVAGNKYYWDLDPALLQSWLDNPSNNHGLVLRNNSSTFKFFYSKEYGANPDFHPKVIIEYLEQSIGDWSSPAEESNLNFSGNQNGLKIQVQGNYAYIVLSGGNPDFIVMDVSDPANPSIVGSLVLPGGPRNIAVSGGFAYVASNRNNQELQVIDISIPASPSLVGSLNLSGNADANGIYYDSSKVYMVRTNSGDDELSIIDVTTPASPSEIGSLNLNSTAYEILVLSNYAYIASASNSQELQIINITNPAAPVAASTYNLSGNDDAYSITGYNNIVLLGRSNGDVSIVDITSPSSPVLLGNYNDFGDDIRDISLGNENNYAFLASDANSAEFQVIDISIPTTPTIVGSLDLSGDLNGIAYLADLDRALVVGDDNNNEFRILAPQ